MLAVSELEGLKFILNVRDAVLRYYGAQEKSRARACTERASLKRACTMCMRAGKRVHLFGFIILVVYRSLIDGGYSVETTPLAGPKASPPSISLIDGLGINHQRTFGNNRQGNRGR